jgi:hypothetical protein
LSGRTARFINLSQDAVEYCVMSRLENRSLAVAATADPVQDAIALRGAPHRFAPAALAFTGFAATPALFWPGLMTHDAAWVHAARWARRSATGNRP